jgi:hypothetical protein
LTKAEQVLYLGQVIKGELKMRKQITLTIDSEVYDKIKDTPMKVSISEVVSWVLKGMVEDLKKGREMTSAEVKAWMEQTAEGKDFRDRLIAHWGPTIYAIEDSLGNIKDKIKPKGSAKKKK